MARDLVVWGVVILRTAIVVLVLLSMSARALAEESYDPALEREAQAVFAEVMSPFCPGRLLRDCPSSAASELKSDVRRRLLAGEDRTAILEYLFALYGEAIRAAPRGSGFGVVAWLGPVFFVLIGGLIIATWLRRKRGDPLIASGNSQIATDLKRRIESEIEG